MEEKINNLIQHYTEARLEVNALLTELNSIDLSKVSSKEKRSIREAIIKSAEELHLRKVFIQDLETLFEDVDWSELKNSGLDTPFKMIE